MFLNTELIGSEDAFYEKFLTTLFDGDSDSHWAKNKLKHWEEELNSQSVATVTNSASKFELAISKFVSFTGSKRFLVVLDGLSQALVNIHDAHGETQVVRLLQVLRDLRHNSTNNEIQFIYAGSLNFNSVLEKLGSTYLLNDLISVDLAPLTESEARQFVLLMLQNADFDMHDNQIDYMLNYLQWQMPYHIQLLINAITDAVGGQATRVTNSQINNAVSVVIGNELLFKSVYDDLKSVFNEIDLFFIQQLFDKLSTTTQMTLANILKLSDVPQLDKYYIALLDKLVQTSFIHADGEDEHYRFTSGLFKGWWQNHQLTGVIAKPAVSLKNIKIVSLSIENIKCFDNIKMNFEKDNNMALILGTNAKGKTTILQLIALGLSGVGYVPFPCSWKQVVKVGSEAGFFTLEITCEGKAEQLCFEIDQSDSITCIKGIEFVANIQQHFLLLAYGANRHIKLEDPRPNPAIEAIATLFGENGYLKNIKVSENYNFIAANFPVIKALVNSVLEKGDLEKRYC